MSTKTLRDPPRGEAVAAEENPPRRSLHIEVGWRTFVAAAVVFVGAGLLVKVWPIVVVVLTALMIVGTVSPLVTKLEMRGCRRPYAIAIVFSTIFAVVLGFVVFTVPRICAELVALTQRLPTATNDLANFLERNEASRPLARSVRDAGSIDVMQKIVAALLAYTPKVVELVALAVTTCFLALYLVIDRDRMRGAMFALVPRTFHIRLSRIVLKLETIVGGYVRGQVITSIMMGVVTYVVLTFAHAENASALAAFAGVADVLPYIGGVIACAPAVVAALSHSTSAGAFVALALLVYQEIESRIIVPRVYGEALRLPSSMVLLSLLVGGTLLGVIGALLALPVAAAIRMLVDELEVELPGEDQSAMERVRLSADERKFQARAAGAPAEKAAAIATEIAASELKEEIEEEIAQPSAGG